MSKYRLIILLSLIFVSTGVKSMPPSAPAFDPENTFVFVAGVLKWQSPDLSPFSNRNRKDQELYNLFLSAGIKKENTIFLKDNEAVLAGMKSGIENLLRKTNTASTFIFYYAGHGIRNSNGPACLANYDITGDEGKGFETRLIADIVHKNFKGQQVWLLADCCYSGSLIEEGRKISKSGKRVVVLTSSSSSNVSTGNWTFTQTLIDCFKGLPGGDRNKDKEISLVEVKQELFDAMKYREKQLSGTAFFNTDEQIRFNLSPVQPAARTATGEYVYVLQSGMYEPARVISNDGTHITGELYRYSDKVTVTIPVNKTKPIEFMEFPSGTKTQVEWNGKKYPAEIVESKNGFHLVHYTGFDDSWNEWVMYSRIHTSERKKCTIEWSGGWYPGEILQQKDGKYFVHYSGYGSDWDEWTGPERVKF